MRILVRGVACALLISLSLAVDCSNDRVLGLATLDGSESGWHNAVLTIKTCDGAIVYDNITLAVGSSSSAICLAQLPFPNFVVSVTSGDLFPTANVLWTINESLNGTLGNTVLSGGAPFYHASEGCSSTVECGTAGWTLTMHDSFGDGWNGNYMTVYDCSMNYLNQYTLSSGSLQQLNLCLPSTESQGYMFHVGGGVWQNEVTWTILDGDGNVMLFGGAPYDGDLNCPQVSPSPSPTPSLSVSVSPPVECGTAGWQLSMASPYSGNGWNGNYMTVYDCSMNYLNQYTMSSGWFQTLNLCLPSTESQGYKFHVGGGSYQGAVFWTILDGDGHLMLSGGAPYDGDLNCAQVSPSPSPTPSLSVSVSPPVECGTAGWTLTMHDSYGDGWNGNYMTVYDCSMNYLNQYTLSSGSYQQLNLCLPSTESQGYMFHVGGGSYQGEVTWTILDAAGNVMLSGGAPYDGDLNCAPPSPSPTPSPSPSVEPSVTSVEVSASPSPAASSEGSCVDQDSQLTCSRLAELGMCHVPVPHHSASSSSVLTFQHICPESCGCCEDANGSCTCNNDHLVATKLGMYGIHNCKQLLNIPFVKCDNSYFKHLLQVICPCSCH